MSYIPKVGDRFYFNNQKNVQRVIIFIGEECIQFQNYIDNKRNGITLTTNMKCDNPYWIKINSILPDE